MAYNGTMITEAELAFFEGANVAAGGKTEAAHNFSVLQAEAYLSNLVKSDLVTNWATLDATYKLLFTEYVGRHSAVMAIQYDMSGFTSRVEAEDMLNIHLFRMDKVEKLLLSLGVKHFQGV